MNTEKLERWILLRHSGELGRWKSKRLERCLAQNAELRQFDADLRLLNEASRAWQIEPRDSDTAVAIHARSATGADRREEFTLRPSHVPAWRPIMLGAAALLLVGVGLWFRNSEPAGRQTAAIEQSIPPASFAWDDGIDEELDALQELVTETGAELAMLSNESGDEEALINTLLELEGTKI
ncbi:MAG: hypothetical protein M5U15_01230 [Kiritimatiellae bacterium]|nr:hypothetical protein [Kiritimatiellia bacterium]